MSDKKIVMNLEAIMGDRFGKYSKYIIQERALPDVRDGLKPVQRRILYSMNKEGNTASKPYRKSAKTVGNVIGNYHPHGDMSVYDAMVRLSQEWKIRAPLLICKEIMDQLIMILLQLCVIQRLDFHQLQVNY